MFWIDAILMLVCGWLGGVISTLVVRYVLEGRKPLDPKMLPTPVSLPDVEAWHKRNPPPPDFSPYAPKPERSSPNTEAVREIWRAAKQERTTRWKEGPKPHRPAPPPQPPVPPPSVPPPLPPTPTLLPSIPWGA